MRNDQEARVPTATPRVMCAPIMTRRRFHRSAARLAGSLRVPTTRLINRTNGEHSPRCYTPAGSAARPLLNARRWDLAPASGDCRIVREPQVVDGPPPPFTESLGLRGVGVGALASSKFRALKALGTADGEAHGGAAMSDFELLSHDGGEPRERTPRLPGLPPSRVVGLRDSARGSLCQPFRNLHDGHTSSAAGGAQGDPCLTAARRMA